MDRKKLKEEIIEIFNKKQIEKFKDEMGIMDEGDIVSEEDLFDEEPN